MLKATCPEGPGRQSDQEQLRPQCTPLFPPHAPAATRNLPETAEPPTLRGRGPSGTPGQAGRRAALRLFPHPCSEQVAGDGQTHSLPDGFPQGPHLTQDSGLNSRVPDLHHL